MIQPSSFVRATVRLDSTPFWKQHCLVWLGILCLAVPIRIFAMHDPAAGFMSALVSQAFGCVLTLVLRHLYLELLERHMVLAVVAFAIGLAHLGGIVDVMITNALLTHFPDQGSVEPFGVYFLTRSRMYLFWSATYGAYIYRQFALRNERDIAGQRTNILELEALVRAAEIRMLRAQVSPHFLFNALTVAIADLKRRPDSVREMLNAMADYFRYAQTNRERTFVPLGEEYDAILKYLIVQKACLRDQLVLRTSICAPARAMMAPGLLLQPLVENALQHGRRTDAMPLHLTIDIRRTGDCLRISVANSGDWLERRDAPSGEDTGGSGLPNLRSRLALCYGEAASLAIEASAELVNVIIVLPALDTAPAAQGKA